VTDTNRTKKSKGKAFTARTVVTTLTVGGQSTKRGGGRKGKKPAGDPREGEKGTGGYKYEIG